MLGCRERGCGGTYPSMNWISMAFWAAVILLFDAGIGLLGEQKFHRLAPNLPIRTIALIEGGLALILLALYFMHQAS